jgi:peroxiredoxin
MKNAVAVVVLSVVFAALGTVAVLWWLEPPRPRYGSYPPGYGPIEFKDDVATNFETGDKLPLEFRDRDGKVVKLGDYHGRKNVALIFMRGITKVPGGVCPTCSAQTSRLIANYDEFVKRDTEILVVFPGPKEHAQQYVQHIRSGTSAADMPFPVLIDEDFKALDRLGIRDDAAKPSTFLLDKQGQVRFAYVGETSTDRPSLKALYQQLDAFAATP